MTSRTTVVLDNPPFGYGLVRDEIEQQVLDLVLELRDGSLPWTGIERELNGRDMTNYCSVPWSRASARHLYR